MQRALFLIVLLAAIWLIVFGLKPPAVSGPAHEEKKENSLKEFLAQTYEKNARELEYQHQRGRGDVKRATARQQEIEAYRKKAQEVRNTSQ